MNQPTYMKSPRAAFSLVEILVSVAIFALIMVAIKTVLYTALDLRDKAYQSTEKADAQSYALNVLRTDLQTMAAPDSILVQGIYGAQQGSLNQRQDSLVFYSTNALAMDDLPGTEIQRIEYALMEYSFLSETRTERNDLTLVRTVTRNLLAATQPETKTQPLLRHVLSLEFAYYDGSSWMDSWDSTSQDPPMPTAVRVRVVQVKTEDEKQFMEPMELLVSVLTVASEEEETETEESESSTEDDSGSQEQGGDTSPQEGQGPGGGGMQNPGGGGRA